MVTNLSDIEATNLPNVWALRPKDQVGTCGFTPHPWNVVYVRHTAARCATDAIRKFGAKVYNHG